MKRCSHEIEQDPAKATTVRFTAWQRGGCSGQSVPDWTTFALNKCTGRGATHVEARCLGASVLLSWYNSTACAAHSVQGMLRFDAGRCYPCQSFVPGVAECGHLGSIEGFTLSSDGACAAGIV